ncbi:MAG TPA: DNA-binding protein WhiA [Tenericutes bacterium]|nr:DNA-binding protein WhiA [Mycoplasmatota bacterium]
MSFAQEVKNEIVKLDISETAMLAQLSAIIRINGSLVFSKGVSLIDIKTENAAIARHVFILVKNKYNITPTLLTKKKVNLNKKNIYIVRIDKDVEKILSDLSISDGHLILNSVPKEYIVDDGENKSAYLRGAFLASGSINDPKTSRYHQEITVDDESLAEFIKELMNSYDLNAKVIRRKKGYVVYIKEAEKISDFLRVINASNALLYFEDIRIYRDHKNMTNRLNNCEQANIEKSMEAAQNQIKNIHLIEEHIGLNSLDDKLKEAAVLRLRYKDASLKELSEIISKETKTPITKSGLSHRFNKIAKIAKRFK